jgi:predicted enzyme related to lactoylglutathione lyase
MHLTQQSNAVLSLCQYNIGDYSHLDTGGADASPDGGLMKRMHPGQAIITYFSVPSITRAAARIEKLGGKVCKPKTAVPGMGYLAICADTENNTFAIWEMNPKAK